VVKTSKGVAVTTTRCPIKVDGEILVSEKGAPLLGEHNTDIDQQFNIIDTKELQPIVSF
jgi:crotonobetainyl-CoA:carnitine CoA-transferase CaiB-like acyl-CoA transferase